MREAHRRFRFSLMIAAIVALVAAAGASAATLSAGNGVYKVFVDDASSSNAGQFTAQTDTHHPQGAGLNVLFGGGSPGTSYTTIHSFTTNTDYTNAGGSIAGSTGLGAFATSVVPLGPSGSPTGYRTTYVLPGPTTTPDKLAIVQDVNVSAPTSTARTST